VREKEAEGAYLGFAAGRNLNTGAPLGQTVEMAVAEQRIYHDAEHPSGVVLPVIPLS
jgi:hypothetical protein